MVFEDQTFAVFSNPQKILTSLKDQEWLWKAKPCFQAILRSTHKVYPRNCFLPTQISQLSQSHGVSVDCWRHLRIAELPAAICLAQGGF